MVLPTTGLAPIQFDFVIVMLRYHFFDFDTILIRYLGS